MSKGQIVPAFGDDNCHDDNDDDDDTNTMTTVDAKCALEKRFVIREELKS